MAYLKFNPKLLKWYGNSGDSVPDGLQVGDKAYFFNTSNNVVYNGTTFVDDVVNTDTTLEVGDLEIGAVEIKNATDDTRATVGANGLYVDVRNIQAGSNKIGSVTIRNNADDSNIDPLAEATFTARVGEVQTTPTANTLLGRLKDLLTGIVLNSGSNIIGKVGIDQTTDGTTNKVQARNATHDDFCANANIQIANADASTSNPIPVVNVGEYARGVTTEADNTLTWANSAIINTTQTITIEKSTNNPKTHEIVILNQSTASALSVDIGNIEPNMGFTNPTDTMKSVLTTVTIPASTAVVIEDCEDAWNEQAVADVTATADSGTKQVGSNSAKFAIGANVAAGTIIGSESISSTNLSPYTHIYAWVYSSVALDAGDMQLLLDNTANCASPLEIINIPAITATTWTRVRVPLASPDSDLAIISIGLKMVVDKGAFDFYIDDVNAVKQSNVSTIVQGFRNGVDGFIRIANASVLTSVQGFQSKVRVKELF